MIKLYGSDEAPAMVAEPEVLLRLPVGLASPLWLMFTGAASVGVAYWWMTRWMRPTNLEALLAVETPAAEREPAMIEASVIEVAAIEAPAIEAPAIEAPKLEAAKVEAPAAPAPERAAEATVEAPKLATSRERESYDIESPSFGRTPSAPMAAPVVEAQAPKPAAKPKGVAPPERSPTRTSGPT